MISETGLPEPAGSSAAAVIPVPGFGTGLAQSLDLSLHAARRLRPASIYIGLQFLGVLAPLTLFLVAMFVRYPELGILLEVPGGELPPSIELRAAGWFLLVIPGMIVALLGLVALGIDSQIIAILILAGQLTGRPVTLRAAVSYSRFRFWPVLRAGLLVGIPTAIVSGVLTEAFSQVLGRNSEGPALAASALATIVFLPFVYVGGSVVLGEVGAIEAVRRSIRLVQARWGLAVLVAAFGAAIGYVEFFALGSGGDILARIGSAAGLGFDRGLPAASATVALILAAIVALGSLTFTVTALAAAPQVVAFVALTGYLGGLERARLGPPGAGTDPWARWVTRPMLTGIAIGAVCALVGIVDVLKP